MEEQVDYLMSRLEMKLVTPRVVVENDWDMRGAHAYSLYVTKEKPLFFIQPLYEMFRDALIREGVDHESSVRVGGKTNRHPPRRVLEIKSQNMNNEVMATGRRQRVRVPMMHLVLRRKDNGITMHFWKRAVKVFIFRGFSMNWDLASYIYEMLTNLEYPRYVALDALRQGDEIVGKLARLINDVKEGDARGWPAVL